MFHPSSRPFVSHRADAIHIANTDNPTVAYAIQELPAIRTNLAVLRRKLATPPNAESMPNVVKVSTASTASVQSVTKATLTWLVKVIFNFQMKHIPSFNSIKFLIP